MDSLNSLSGMLWPVTVTTTIAITTLLLLKMFRGEKKSKSFLNKSRQQFALIGKRVISHDTRIFRFGLPESDMVLGLPVGQHFQLFAPNTQGKEKGKWNGRDDIEADVTEISRKYTPVTGDETKGYVELIIKVYEGGVKEKFVDGGKMSQYMDKLKIGDCVDIMGPVGRLNYLGCGHFCFKDVHKRGVKHIGMMAGGTGITPMLQIISAVLNNPQDETNLSLLYANQTEDDILVRQQLESYTKNFPDRFNLWYTVDNAPEGKEWKYSVGFISVEMIEKHLPAPSSETVVLLCGPPPMIQYCCQPHLAKLGYEASSIMTF